MDPPSALYFRTVNDITYMSKHNGSEDTLFECSNPMIASWKATAFTHHNMSYKVLSQAHK